LGKITCKSVLLAFLVTGSSLFSLVAYSAGLGKLTVLSSLGQPLRAEIEVVSLQPGEGESLTARLASAEAFRQANIDLNGALLGVQFGIERRAGGQYVLTLRSAQPMNEPFIDALIELNWTGGRLVREYVFLLDPPEYRGPVVASAPAVSSVQASPAPAVSPPAATVIAPAEPPRPTVSAPAPAPEPSRAAAAPIAPPTKPAGTYEVKRGDTLARIAQQNSVQGVSLQQMLAALYRGNREAFDGENMNRLRAGRILNLPGSDAAAAISQADAQRLVNTQGSEYAAYRRGIGAAVAEAPSRADSGRQASGRIGAPAEAAPARAQDAAKDQLRLSRTDDTKAGGRAGAAAAQDDAASREKALKEANERIALLEKNLADMQKLAQLKSQTGAQLQQQAAKAEAGKAAATPAPAPAPAAAPAPKAADAVTAPAPEPAKAPDVAKSAEAPKATEAPKPAAPKAPPKPVAPPPPPPGMLEELTSNPLTLAGAGGVVILLAGYAFYAVRKRRKLAAANSAAAMASADANSMLASSSVDIDTSSSQFDGELSQEGAGKVEVEEIDPIAEADVYMAYGRDAQAEEILKEALAKDSTRLPVRLKLMEIYANRKDASSFATEATILHAATGGEGAEWEKAAGMGAAIDPGNSLYGGAAPAPVDLDAGDTQVMNIGEMVATPEAGAAAEAAAAPSELDFDLGAVAETQPDIDLGAEAVAEAPVAAPEEISAPTTLDFDLDLGSDAPKVEEAAAMEAAPAVEAAAADDAGGLSIDFDLPTSDAEATEAALTLPEPAPEAAPAQPDDGGLSIDFDLGESAPELPAAVEEPALDLSSISLDLGEPTAEGEAPAPDAHWQEVATKLDLAKAYQEMGDKDGAKELLNEVLGEGDAAQQEQARTILESLN